MLVPSNVRLVIFGALFPAFGLKIYDGIRVTSVPTTTAIPVPDVPEL